ncbi:hypothetical protein V6N13_104639 [Hibiscus sabdariffa]
MDDMLDVGFLVLATITLELQKQHEYVVSYEMIQNLKEILKGKHDSREVKKAKAVGASVSETAHEKESS